MVPIHKCDICAAKCSFLTKDSNLGYVVRTITLGDHSTNSWDLCKYCTTAYNTHLVGATLSPSPVQHPKLWTYMSLATGLDTESPYNYYVQHPYQVNGTSNHDTRNPLCILTTSNGAFTVALCFAFLF